MRFAFQNKDFHFIRAHLTKSHLLHSSPNALRLERWQGLARVQETGSAAQA
jgi:hypothetical protein